LWRSLVMEVKKTTDINTFNPKYLEWYGPFNDFGTYHTGL